jgi:putative transposase
MTIHNRHSIRLKGYDYRLEGAYFITMNIQNVANLMGEIVDGSVHRSLVGECAAAVLQTLPQHFPVTLGEWVIMPNHLHAILVLEGDSSKGEASGMEITLKELKSLPDASPLKSIPSRPKGTKSGSLNAIIQNYKSVSTRRINFLRGSPGKTLWQRNYYEHIIRNDEEWARIAAYINNNPSQPNLTESYSV